MVWDDPQRGAKRVRPTPRGDAVLMYHSVGVPYPDGRTFENEEFRRHLEFLSEQFEVVRLPAVLEHHASERPRVAITFDGGYANFHENAYPVLREFDAPATVFAIPTRVGRVNDPPKSTIWTEWFDFMDADQLRTLVGDEMIEIGNKTLDHDRILPAIRDRSDLARQVNGGKEALESLLDIEVGSFCYPSGRYNDRSIAVVSEGHRLAVSTRPRFVRDGTDPMVIPRFDADAMDVATLGDRLTVSFERRARMRDRVNRVLGLS